MNRKGRRLLALFAGVFCLCLIYLVDEKDDVWTSDGIEFHTG